MTRARRAAALVAAALALTACDGNAIERVAGSVVTCRASAPVHTAGEAWADGLGLPVCVTTSRADYLKSVYTEGQA